MRRRRIQSAQQSARAGAARGPLQIQPAHLAACRPSRAATIALARASAPPAPASARVSTMGLCGSGRMPVSSARRRRATRIATEPTRDVRSTLGQGTCRAPARSSTTPPRPHNLAPAPPYRPHVARRCRTRTPGPHCPRGESVSRAPATAPIEQSAPPSPLQSRLSAPSLTHHRGRGGAPRRFGGTTDSLELAGMSTPHASRRRPQRQAGPRSPQPALLLSRPGWSQGSDRPWRST
mmetsp:Transcript_28250/g.90040  ORF Transcript_28250/g.90040 Transcript_28250/m.90040 type:complete len:236 (-) Transcript_28250:137-844(-)